MVLGVSGWETYAESGGYGARGEEVRGGGRKFGTVGVAWAEDVTGVFVGWRAKVLGCGHVSEPQSLIMCLGAMRSLLMQFVLLEAWEVRGRNVCDKTKHEPEA